MKPVKSFGTHWTKFTDSLRGFYEYLGKTKKLDTAGQNGEPATTGFTGAQRRAFVRSAIFVAHEEVRQRQIARERSGWPSVQSEGTPEGQAGNPSAEVSQIRLVVNNKEEK